MQGFGFMPGEAQGYGIALTSSGLRIDHHLDVHRCIETNASTSEEPKACHFQAVASSSRFYRRR